MRYFWGISRDSGESMLYVFDEHSLRELGARVDEHKNAGLMTERQAMDCIEFAEDVIEERQLLWDAVEWRKGRNLESLKGGK